MNVFDELLEKYGYIRISQTSISFQEFVAEGLNQRKRADITGGGLVRSAGGWRALAAFRRRDLRMKADERILGSSDFVERVLTVEKMLL